VIPFLLLPVLLLSEVSENSRSAPDPISSYQQQNVRGWDVYVHKSLFREHQELGTKALELLDSQLYLVERTVPQPAVNKLQQIPIWLEVDDDRDSPCACYHVSENWLKNNGYLPQKVRSVQISSAQRFLDWVKSQPYMILHELAHGYHHRELGYDHAPIKSAYQAAKSSGSYESVLHFTGEKTKHYAIENPMEYFAEGSEAYFGTNDFYPFTNAELKQHDPELYRLLETVWENPNSEAD